MPRNGPMTVERALAEAHKAGCVFRLAGAGIDVRGINAVPADIVTFLRGNRELVFAHLGGNERDRPSLELLSTLDIELVYCTDDVTAESVIAEIIADAGAGPIAIDIETARAPRVREPSPSPAHRTRPADEGAAEAERQGWPRPASLRAAPGAALRRGRPRRRARHALGVLAVLAPLWQRPLVAHNAAFELAFLAKRGIHPRMQCTMQAAGLLLGVERRCSTMRASLPGR